MTWTGSLGLQVLGMLEDELLGRRRKVLLQAVLIDTFAAKTAFLLDTLAVLGQEEIESLGEGAVPSRTKQVLANDLAPRVGLTTPDYSQTLEVMNVDTVVAVDGTSKFEREWGWNVKHGRRRGLEPRMLHNLGNLEREMSKIDVGEEQLNER